MSRKFIYGAVALVIIGAIVWYVMRAQNQAAAINGAGATPGNPATT